jgi:hypothetical protein
MKESEIQKQILDYMKFRKKQWEHSLYEHRALVKTRTFEKLCVNPDCPKHWDPKKLPPSWIPVGKAMVGLGLIPLGTTLMPR